MIPNTHLFYAILKKRENKLTGLASLYGITIFLSAFLLFQIQPIIGKMILPWFGGSAGVWITCLLFFQSLLLLGYLYAHCTIRFLRPKIQAILHLGLLALSVVVLPIALSPNWKPVGSDEPVSLILGLLSVSIGLPYFLLSSTGPLLQSWFAKESPGTVPYRLFALSNFASLIGLLGYPILIEPWLAIHTQSLVWSFTYITFVFVCGRLAWRGSNSSVAKQETALSADGGAPSARLQALWVALAVCPSILLMATTTYVTQDIAPIPLLWILPLSFYLISFILCFERNAWYRRSWYVPLLVISLSFMAYGFVEDLTDLGEWIAVAIYCGSFFIACMVCHGELAKLKPHPEHLTNFYLMIAIGGALGGMFVAVIAPRVFNSAYEIPIGLVATSILVVVALYRDEKFRLHKLPGKIGWLILIGLILWLIFYLWRGASQTIGHSRLMVRNFYGSLRTSDAGDDEDLQRTLRHGIIVHGEQYLDADRLRWPTTYYGEKTGVGVAILSGRSEAPQRVGVIGLGAGTLAVYGRSQDYYRFYEINPRVVQIAQSEFSFLSDSPAKIDLSIGDARLLLEKQAPQNFDVLVVDAFSGDAIPIHLLTREAFALYIRHLKPGGILAVHVSNRYLDLAPIVKLAAEHFGMHARLIDSDEDEDTGVYTAGWVLVTASPDVFTKKALVGVAVEIRLKSKVQPWTDDYSSIYSILN